MPEGDTVWLAGRRLHDALAGRALTGSDFRVPALATVDLSGRDVREVVSRGKHLLTRIEGGLTLHTHFRMEGSWHLYRPREKWRGGAAWQIRAVLTNAEWAAVGYRLPVVELVATAAEDTAVGHLGPDLLAEDWDDAYEAEAIRRLTQDPDTPIGEALLDQRNLAGIGTLYRSETLFLRGIHPRRRVSEVDNADQVVRLARRLLMANRAHPQQSTTGDIRRGRQHYVFGRAGQPCLRCGTRIGTEEFGPPGQERRSFWCPACQPR